jgi:hypothetical protein
VSVAGPSLVLVGEQASFTAMACSGGVETDVTAQATFSSSRSADPVAGNRVTFPVQGLRQVTAAYAGSRSAPWRVIAVADAPVFVAQPALGSYSPRVGTRLTVSPGEWEPGGSRSRVSFQWLADGAPISGATSSAYTPTPGDLGKRLSVRIGVSHPETFGQGQLTTGASDPVAPGSAPALAPVIAGSGQVGTPWVASVAVPDGWGEASFQWQRHGVDIPGASGPVYVAGPADIDAPVTVHAVAQRPAYDAAAGVSPQVTAIVGGPWAGESRIGGTASVGKVLTVVGAPEAPWVATYQWLRAGAAISGATSPTYTPVTADAGKSLAVNVQVSREGYQASTHTPAVSVAKIRPKITAKPASKRITTGTRAVVRVTVKASGIANPTGTVRVTIGKTVKKYALKAAHKGKITLKLPRQKRGTIAVRVAFMGSSQIAKKTAKAFKLRVR